VFSSRKRIRVTVDHNEDQSAQPAVDKTNADKSLQYVLDPLGGEEIQTEPLDGQQTVSALLARQTHTSIETLELLHEAHHNSGNAVTNTSSFGSGKESEKRNRNDAGQDDIALIAWSNLRFVRSGLFTAGEALSYVTWFYTNHAPFSPVPCLRFKDPLQHAKLIEEEPVLALTILTIAARGMKLNGPGSITRGCIIHDRLWSYLRGMIGAVFWSEENFLSEGTATQEVTQHGVLRNVGTCEAFLLLLEWYPGAIHLPPVGNDTNSITMRDGVDRTSYVASVSRNGRMRAGVDWLSRSDRMCCSLLGLARH
jgi:hypothetical protein